MIKPSDTRAARDSHGGHGTDRGPHAAPSIDPYRFDALIGIDYSGAGVASARCKGLQVYEARPGLADTTSPRILRPRKASAANWTRREIAHLLRDRVRSGERFLAGIDHNFSMPWTYFQRYGLSEWPGFLEDFVRYWPTHLDGVSVEDIRRAQALQPDSDRRTGTSSEFRITERWTSSAKSVFQFDMQGSVAKSSHAGIPWLKWLRDEVGEHLHVWPFDGWTPHPDKCVLAEVYPSIFRNRYPRGERTVDEQDAFACAQWMVDMAARGRLSEYFARPPLDDEECAVVACEGWVLGVR